jgi:hypothetical protein
LTILKKKEEEDTNFISKQKRYICCAFSLFPPLCQIFFVLVVSEAFIHKSKWEITGEEKRGIKIQTNLMINEIN